MIRIKVIVEGQTEEAFLNDVVAPSLWTRQIFITPIVLGVTGHKGGNVKYQRVRKDILLQLKQDRTAYCSTMFDLYGLGTDFPGFDSSLNGTGRAERIEKAVKEDIEKDIPELRHDHRLIPYLQVHEYEGLLFSDTSAFAVALSSDSLAPKLRVIRDSFRTPEDINDNPNSAPSKRILALYPGYQKVIEGTLAAKEIGLPKIRQECPHFNDWLTRLESRY